MNAVGKPIKTTVTMPSQITTWISGEAKTTETIWEEREKRLQELLEKDGGPNPKAKKDFNRLLEEVAKGSKEA